MFESGLAFFSVSFNSSIWIVALYPYSESRSCVISGESVESAVNEQNSDNCWKVNIAGIIAWSKVHLRCTTWSLIFSRKRIWSSTITLENLFAHFISRMSAIWSLSLRTSGWSIPSRTKTSILLEQSSSDINSPMALLPLIVCATDDNGWAEIDVDCVRRRSPSHCQDQSKMTVLFSKRPEFFIADNKGFPRRKYKR